MLASTTLIFHHRSFPCIHSGLRSQSSYASETTSLYYYCYENTDFTPLPLRRSNMNFAKGNSKHRVVCTPLVFALVVLIAVGSATHVTGDGDQPSRCKNDTAGSPGNGRVGAPREIRNASNSLEITELGKYAVSEYNAKQGSELKFERVVKASEQTVAGILYTLTLEATCEKSSETKVYEARIWIKPWLGQKSLEEFEEAATC